MFPTIQPGVLEVFCGPMKSGKTRELINRVDKVHFLDGHDFVFFKPAVDTRHEHIRSRFGELTITCQRIPRDNPERILRESEGISLILIDEAQFFNRSVISVVEELLHNKVNVVVAGLDLDFRGEPFGPMPTLLSQADEVTKLSAVCDVKGCAKRGVRTQRLIGGEPAPYDAPIVRVEHSSGNETYEVRCLQHHRVR